MKITVWGDTLAAWVAAIQFATFGNDVIKAGSDRTPGQSSIRSEPTLMQELENVRRSGQLRYADAVNPYNADIHWLVVAPDQREAAFEIINKVVENQDSELLLVNQSNFGTGTSDHFQLLLNSEAGQFVIYYPDALQEGSAMQQFLMTNVMLLGCEDEPARLRFNALMRPFTRSLDQLRLMTRREAEFSKFAITGMLALRLGYINELATLADQVGVDIEVVRDGMSTDPRIGGHYLEPGCGFGGQTFTQYIEGLAGLLSQAKGSMLLETVLEENERHKETPFRKLWQHYQCDLKDRKIAIWGLAFKPGVASVDNAPSLRVIDALIAQGAQLRVHDPEALEEIRDIYGDHPQIHYCRSAYQAAEGTDALLVLTAWSEYWSPDYSELHDLMKEPLIIDGRNMFEPQLMHDLGFTYYGIGRTSH